MLSIVAYDAEDLKPSWHDFFYATVEIAYSHLQCSIVTCAFTSKVKYDPQCTCVDLYRRLRSMLVCQAAQNYTDAHQAAMFTM